MKSTGEVHLSITGPNSVLKCFTAQCLVCSLARIARSHHLDRLAELESESGPHQDGNMSFDAWLGAPASIMRWKMPR